MELNEREKEFLNCTVLAKQTIIYPGPTDLVVPTGTRGEIVDYGSVTGDPVIIWELGNSQYRGIAYWSTIEKEGVATE